MQTQTFNIALPKELVEQIDITAKKEYRNRSELIREALRMYLEDKKEWEYLFQTGKQIAAKMNIKSEAQVNKLVYEVRHANKKQ